MSELESSGLLDKDSPQPPGPMEEHTASAAPETHTSGGSSSPSSGAEQPGPQSAEAEANLAATIVKAVTDDQGEVVRQEEAGKVLEQHPSEASGLVSEPAEQRVLGDLQGAPTWREVLCC